MSIRLAVVTTSYPLIPGSVSGVFVARLIESLPPSVFATVITPASHTTNAGCGMGRVAIRCFRYAPRRLQTLAHEPGGIPVALRTHTWAYLLLPGFLLAMLASCLRRGRSTDLIHANWAICGCVAGLAGKLLRVPVITTLRGDDVTRAQQSLTDRIILSLCLHWSHAVVTVSRSIETWIQQQYPHHTPKTCLIENGVEDVFLELPAGRDIAPGEPRLRLLAVGSLIARKGVDQIIAALHRLPERGQTMLTIVGDGPEREHLLELARTLGLQRNVEFTGALTPSAIPREFARAHVFVLASHSEGRPNVILEAMAAALPVVASDIPGVNELVEHGHTGLLFRPGVIEELAQHLLALVRDATLRDRLGRAGRDFILQRQLRWRTTAAQYYRLYTTLMETR
jgi:glycosyltransferase involved in cell wall biosynthesis